MSAWNHQPTPTLADWLNTATEKLTPPAKDRIKLEITSHFNDALESLLAGGWSAADAQAKVLADLGDARSAARRFRRKHLTNGDVKIIKANMYLIKGGARRITLLLCAGVLGADFGGDGLQRFGRHDPIHLLVAIVAVFWLSCASTFYFLPRGKALNLADAKKKLRPNVSALLRVSSILDFTYLVAVWLVFGFTWLGFLTACPLLLAKLLGSRNEIRLLLKLRRMADVWQEMPPPGATAS